MGGLFLFNIGMDLGLEMSIGKSYKQIVNLKTMKVNLTVSDNTQF